MGTKNNTGQEQDDYLRTAEVARLLHVSPKTISRWAKEERLPFVRTLGGHRRFPADSIKQLANKMAEEMRKSS